jgi:4-hydroxybenzoate polyprenyltransferase
MTVGAVARMVKFSHSLFALPFAVSAVVLVSGQARLDPLRLGLVALAVVAARTAAMAMNRIADRAFDATNPRTRSRELVTGEVSPAAARLLLAASSLVFVGAAARLSPLTGWLSLPVLAILLGYSYAKRFTWACHLWLGVAQALGPVGVAIALTGTTPPSAVLLGLGVGAWIAGFDVFYSMQDMDFDRSLASRGRSPGPVDSTSWGSRPSWPRERRGARGRPGTSAPPSWPGCCSPSTSTWRPTGSSGRNGSARPSSISTPSPRWPSPSAPSRGS